MEQSTILNSLPLVCEFKVSFLMEQWNKKELTIEEISPWPVNLEQVFYGTVEQNKTHNSLNLFLIGEFRVSFLNEQWNRTEI